MGVDGPGIKKIHLHPAHEHWEPVIEGFHALLGEAQLFLRCIDLCWLTGVPSCAGKLSPYHEATLLRTWQDFIVFVAMVMPFVLLIGFMIYQMGEYRLAQLQKSAPILLGSRIALHSLTCAIPASGYERTCGAGCLDRIMALGSGKDAWSSPTSAEARSISGALESEQHLHLVGGMLGEGGGRI
jgi:hypothetical protein